MSRIEWRLTGKCPRLADVPQGARVTAVNGKEVDGHCESCGGYILEDSPRDTWAEGEMTHRHCPRPRMVETGPATHAPPEELVKIVLAADQLPTGRAILVEVARRVIVAIAPHTFDPEGYAGIMVDRFMKELKVPNGPPPGGDIHG